MDNETKAKLMYELTETPGWTILDNYLIEQVKGNINELKSNKFKELAEVAGVQGEISALEKLYGFINNIKLRGKATE